MAGEAAGWTWGGLRKGDPYNQGAPGKPLSPAPSTTGPQFDPWFNRAAPQPHPQWNPSGGWPGGGGTGQVWDTMRGLQGRPAGTQFSPEQTDFMGYWQPHTPPPGLPLPPLFRGPAGREISSLGENDPFNSGPSMASAPGGDGGLGGWEPAQAEQFPRWQDNA